MTIGVIIGVSGGTEIGGAYSGRLCGRRPPHAGLNERADLPVFAMFADRQAYWSLDVTVRRSWARPKYAAKKTPIPEPSTLLALTDPVVDAVAGVGRGH